MTRGKLTRAALFALLSTAATIPAYAQTATATDGASEDRDEIIVTANRREENSQDVSGVVQALGADQLRQDGIAELRQLQVAVPGLSIANQEGNVEIFIRGVGSANNTELGDPGAAPHLNGTYIPRPRGLGLMFYDLERVEVNKGPQGTLYGRNALAGRRQRRIATALRYEIARPSGRAVRRAPSDDRRDTSPFAEPRRI